MSLFLKVLAKKSYYNKETVTIEAVAVADGGLVLIKITKTIEGDVIDDSIVAARKKEKDKHPSSSLSVDSSESPSVSPSSLPSSSPSSNLSSRPSTSPSSSPRKGPSQSPSASTV